MKDATWVVFLLTVTMACATASAALTIDGNIDDWEPNNIHDDNPNDAGAPIEITRWGTCIESGRLQGFIEVEQTISQFDPSTSSDPDSRIWFDLWIDVDNSASTALDATGLVGWDTTTIAEDWIAGGAVHNGIDIGFEYGPGDNPISSITPPVYQGHRAYNFWGKQDGWVSLGSYIPPETGTVAVAGSICEFNVDLSAIIAEVATYPDGAVPGPVWRVGAYAAGYDGVSPYWGTDYTPTVLLEIPEPATLTLLAMGGLAVLRRKRK